MYIRSCNIHKLPKGCLSAGKLISEGEESDMVEVRHYFQKSCQAGIREGCQLLNRAKQ